MKKLWFIPALLCALAGTLVAQPGDSSSTKRGKEYEVGGIEVTGNQFTDDNALISLSGLSIGGKITLPGDETRETIKKLMKLRLFTDVQIYQTKKIGEIIFLEIAVVERPRLSRHYFKGVPKGQHDDLNKLMDRVLIKGTIVTENMKITARNALRNYYVEKGFLNTVVTVTEEKDEVLANSTRLGFDIQRNGRIRIQDVVFTGNTKVKTAKLRKLLKKTKRKTWYNIFTTSKFINKQYTEDKEKLIKYYNKIGLRDAAIVHDTVYMVPHGKDGKRAKVEIALNEGQVYRFGKIDFKGNSVYAEPDLRRILGIVKGDIYNDEQLQSRLNYDEQGRDISTLYMDNGYLFFRVNAVETGIDKDSINLEIRIFEGPQATIDKVIIKGNDRTHEHVIRRELRTRPGQKFSRSDIIRSQREIVNLGYFNPEALGINTPVNAQKGTVDIEYTVEEKPADQLELSAGWGGAGRGVIGTLGVSFNNFSLRNIMKPSTWSPLPQGDGQRLSLRVQATGKQFQSYNFSFTEPWLGGKRPNAFSLSASYSRISNGYTKESSNFSRTGIFSMQASLGTRLRWPDDYFISQTALIYQNYALTTPSSTADNGGSFGFRYVNENGVSLPLPDGNYHSLAISQTFTRNSIDEPIYPRNGSKFTLTMAFTPPYSLFSKRDYASETPQQKYKLLEYHKWNFKAEWYHTIVGKLVLKTAIKMGFLGYYNSDIGTPPFDRFEIGGDGITNNVGFQGREIYALRGYADAQEVNRNSTGGTSIFNKYSLELRYPISLNPSSTIYVHTFFDGGNSWNRFREYDPLDLKRSTGVGLRVFLPMFGILGFDYGIGFDKDLPIGTKFSSYGKFNIVLGFEPE